MKDDPVYATSIASWSMALARGLDAYGIDSSKVFASVGIDLGRVESPYARFPVTSVQNVWRYAYENTDELFGLRVAGQLTPASFHALGFGLLASSTIRELLERLIRYRCVISHLFFAELLEDGDAIRFSIADERKIKTGITDDTLFGYILALVRQLGEPDFRPARVAFDRIPAGPTEQLADFIAAPVAFGEASSSITFTRDSLAKPLACGDTGLAAKQDRLVEQYISELGLISEYMLRVNNEIQRLLEQGEVSVNAVAQNLNVTVRTLQRRLKDENSSYHDLLDKIRYRLTLDYLKQPDFSVTQSAFKLGFNDSGSYTRAFRRWTGTSFKDYKKKS